MNRSRAIAGALLAIGLGACGATPDTHYYMLSAVAPAAAPAAAATGAAAPIRLDAVTIPAELDRTQIVRRSGPNQLDLLGLDRWAAPLDEQIRRVLSDDLGRRLPGRVVGPAAPAISEETGIIAVDVDRFDADRQGHVVLIADWSLVAAGRAVSRRTETIELDASGADPASSAAAMSGALGQFADRIAAALAGDR
jgi:uncharacterized lipoprotein YmbA